MCFIFYIAQHEDNLLLFSYLFKNELRSCLSVCIVKLMWTVDTAVQPGLYLGRINYKCETNLQNYNFELVGVGWTKTDLKLNQNFWNMIINNLCFYSI